MCFFSRGLDPADLDPDPKLCLEVLEYSYNMRVHLVQWLNFHKMGPVYRVRRVEGRFIWTVCSSDIKIKLAIYTQLPNPTIEEFLCCMFKELICIKISLYIIFEFLCQKDLSSFQNDQKTIIFFSKNNEKIKHKNLEKLFEFSRQKI